jgi:hypothetical protein
MSNVNGVKRREYVERLYVIERDFNEAKAEHSELVKDIMLEIKSNSEAYGFEGSEIKRLVKIKLDEDAAKEKLAEASDDMETYSEMYESDEEDDPLA